MIIIRYIWRGWFVFLAFSATAILSPFVYILSFRDKDYPAAYSLIRIWCKIIFYGTGFRYQFINKDNLKLDKESQYIFISNHTSIMDIPLMCLIHPHHPICFVGKKELVKIPIFGTIYKRVCVMVDRSSARSRADVYRRCAERMEEGKNIAIYPEGGVPDDTNIILDHFKDGAFILSGKYNFPIAVYTVVGLKEMFPFDNSKGYPGKVKVYFNAILQNENNSEKLKKDSYNLIKSTLDINI